MQKLHKEIYHNLYLNEQQQLCLYIIHVNSVPFFYTNLGNPVTLTASRLLGSWEGFNISQLIN